MRRRRTRRFVIVPVKRLDRQRQSSALATARKPLEQLNRLLFNSCLQHLGSGNVNRLTLSIHRDTYWHIFYGKRVNCFHTQVFKRYNLGVRNGF